MVKKAVELKKQSFVDQIMEEFGTHIIETEESIHDIKNIKVIKTGSTSLDVSLSVGGIPFGRITTIYGPESSAKTTLSLSIARNAILMGQKVLYVDQEQALDISYIRAIIGQFDTTMFVLAQPETAEQTLQICEEGVNSKEFGLIILDSIGALAPEKEKEDEFDKASVGLVPRLVSKFLRRNAFSIRTNNVAFLIINQVRAVIGAYVPTNEMPGGNALRHFSSIIIYMHRSKLLEFGEEVVGAITKYTVKKNKVGIPFRSFYFPLIYGVGIDTIRDTIEFGEMLGVLIKRGSYYYFEGETLGQGVAKTQEYLKEHPETLDKITKACYTNVNIKKGVVNDNEESES